MSVTTLAKDLPTFSAVAVTTLAKDPPTFIVVLVTTLEKDPHILCKTQRGRIFDPGFCQKMKDFWTFFEVFLTLFG